jgi:hypothetical protein
MADYEEETVRDEPHILRSLDDTDLLNGLRHDLAVRPVKTCQFINQAARSQRSLKWSRFK